MRRPAAAIRAILSLGAAAALVLGGPVLAGPAIDRAAGLVAVGHSQLVSSSPGAGEVVASPPSEIRLVFSEPIDPRYTSLDLLDGTGRAILVGAGTPDPADPHVLVAALPARTGLAVDEFYTVNWRALSAADGHSTQGFLTFGVGNVAVGSATHDGSSSSGTGASTGDLHGGHSGGAAAAEVQGKVLGYGGSMLAVGLAILVWLVLRPALGRIPRGAAYGSGIALLAGAAGCLLLVVVAADSLPGGGTVTAGGTDYVGFATTTRIGLLLSARTAVGVVAGIAILVAARLGGGRGPALGLALGGAAGAIGLGLTTAGGHASAFSSPIPAAMDLVHVAAASVWLGGLVMLGALTDFGGQSRLEPGALRSVIPRFSALALVSVALIALTGVYADWVQTRDLLGFDSPYQLNLLVKILVFVLALAVGLLNYLDGGRDLGRRFGLSRRLLVELILGVAVLAITANLTSGSPTGADRAVEIASAPSSAVSAEPASLAVRPGRPGPNRFIAGLPTPPVSGTIVELVLQRLDFDVGSSRITMRPDFTSSTPTFVADGSLPAGTRWDATVVATEPSGVEIARERFVFALDADGISEGRATPPLDPGLTVAVLLLVLGVLGLGYALAGGVLPRTAPDAGRPAMIGASLAGLALGIAALALGGPR
jgi:putative copper export protein/methionine-rich copper-binding protein CopC